MNVAVLAQTNVTRHVPTPRVVTNVPVSQDTDFSLMGRRVQVRGVLQNNVLISFCIACM